MSAAASISPLPRSGNVGADVLQAVIRLVRNRTGRDFAATFNQVQAANPELMRPGYDNFSAALTLGQVLNREEKRTGLAPVAATEQSADLIAALTNRFLPAFADDPTALQWDCLHRAAVTLAHGCRPERLLNRAPEGVSAGDYKSATARAGDVFNLLQAEQTEAVDRGPTLAWAAGVHPEVIRGTFRGAMKRLMGNSIEFTRPGNLTPQQAFDWLQANEPIFWCAAMLSFDV